MNKAFLVLIALSSFSGAACAADMLGFASPKQGKVSFPHKVHQVLVKDCRKCHEKAPGKIEGFGREWAHKVCKGCHVEGKKGPTGCKDCHVK
ncbi:MAG: cytochrome c3 family protein [Desulfuromonadales bacterium]